MDDEFTEEKASCPYCGSDQGCQHHLALFDLTFGECIGGYAFDRYEELEDVVRTAFLGLLESGRQEMYSWNDRDIAELWDIAVKEYANGMDFCIYRFPFIGLLDDIMETRSIGMACGTDYPPGFASDMVSFYHREPQKAFELVLSDLKSLLQSALVQSGEG
jgi:hypothetical protein